LPKEVVIRFSIPTSDEIKEVAEKLGKALGDEVDKVVQDLVKKVGEAGELSGLIKVEVKPEEKPAIAPAEAAPTQSCELCANNQNDEICNECRGHDHFKPKE